MEEHLYNLNIERAVLSTIIFDPAEYEEIASQLKPEDFYHPFHQKLFVAMEELFRADMPIDEEFLREKLTSKKQFDEVAFLDILGANPLSNTQAYIKEKIEILAKDPEKLKNRIKALKGKEYKGLYRLRVGDYCVVYQRKDDVLIILIVRIGHRKEVY